MPMAPIESAITHVLLIGVMPVWVAAGVADWWCHRRSDIAHTSGPRESALHLLMITEVGTGVALALLFQPNALILAALIGLCALHQVTALIDSAYASRHRLIGPFEQHVHSFLDACPLVAVVLLALLNLPQAEALLGFADSPRDFRLLARDPMPPGWLVGAMVCVGALLGVLPFAEEFARGLRAKAARIATISIL